jgi:hypothetical protein
MLLFVGLLGTNALLDPILGLGLITIPATVILCVMCVSAIVAIWKS